MQSMHACAACNFWIKTALTEKEKIAQISTNNHREGGHSEAEATSAIDWEKKAPWQQLYIYVWITQSAQPNKVHCGCKGKMKQPRSWLYFRQQTVCRNLGTRNTRSELQPCTTPGCCRQNNTKQAVLCWLMVKAERPPWRDTVTWHSGLGPPPPHFQADGPQGGGFLNNNDDDTYMTP